MRDRLIELLDNIFHIDFDGDYESGIRDFADHLLENGVIVPPCKVGDTIYVIEYSHLTGDGYILKKHIEAFTIQDGLVYIYYSDPLGRLIKRLPDVSAFFTREEAERALEVVKNGN